MSVHPRLHQGPSSEFEQEETLSTLIHTDSIPASSKSRNSIFNRRIQTQYSLLLVDEKTDMDAYDTRDLRIQESHQKK
jgi:hypothetical protein